MAEELGDRHRSIFRRFIELNWYTGLPEAIQKALSIIDDRDDRIRELERRIAELEAGTREYRVITRNKSGGEWKSGTLETREWAQSLAEHERRVISRLDCYEGVEIQSRVVTPWTKFEEGGSDAGTQ